MELVSTSEITRLPFSQAATAWLESRRYHLAPRTFIDYGRYIAKLSLFFKEMRVPEITSDQLRAYQHARRAEVCPSVVNKEIGLIVMMRLRMGFPLTDYQRLPPPKDYEPPGRALEEVEEDTLLRVCREASDHPTWDIAALATLLSMFSGLGPGEILSLKLKHVRLYPAQITVPRAGAKRLKRERSITLNEEAASALEKLIDRAHKKCLCADPEHYLIPRRNRDHSYDPTRPAQGWRSSLDHLLGIADIKIRRYDFRHHAISKALRNPDVSPEGAKAYFGWVSPRMFQRYGHMNRKTLDVVAAAMSTPKKPVQNVHKPKKTRAV
jgi:integrase